MSTIRHYTYNTMLSPKPYSTCDCRWCKHQRTHIRKTANHTFCVNIYPVHSSARWLLRLPAGCCSNFGVLICRVMNANAQNVQDRAQPRRMVEVAVKRFCLSCCWHAHERVGVHCTSRIQDCEHPSFDAGV